MGETPQSDARSAREEVLLGRYRVLERRGTGGFGAVCTCWDTRLQRRVAIKRIPLADGSGTTAEEALAEARTACLLGHPNIVTLHDYEVEGAYAYLVMEYVDGLNLAELLARVEGGRLMPEECAHILSSVARALSYAHENAALHLDIKPTNIMIDRRGTVKLADFGMASLASAAGYGGARGGTVGYMPPEQIEGMLVDQRTDVFSLAVVVWQALSGYNPFMARSAEDSLAKIMRGPDVSLARSRPDLEPGVEEALLEALEPSARDRTSSVDELVDELMPLLGDEQDGAESLRELIEQAERDDTAAAARRPHPGPGVRLPALGAWLPRALTALAAFSALRTALVVSLGEADALVAALPLAGCAVSAAWPPIAAPLVGCALAWSMASGSGEGALFLIAWGLVVALLAWLVLVARKEHLSSLALLLPCCLPSPVSGAALAGFALDPAPAALTGALGYLMGDLFHVAASSGFSADALLGALASSWLQPEFWIMLAGSVACAWASSSIAMRGSVAAGLAGQTLGLGCIVCAGVIAARMENARIWPSLDWETMVLAVLLFVLLCIATVLRGPLYEGQEGGGSHEFSQ